MLEKVIRMIDAEGILYGKSPTSVSIHPEDWDELYAETTANFNYGPATDPDFPKRNLLIQGVRVIRDPYKERI